VRRFPEERALRAELDDTAAVHHRDPIRERGHDGEVVAHVDRGHAVGVAERTNRLEHVRLRRHVEPGRRLVQDDHPWPARERHRQSDPLLLPAGELMRIPSEELLVSGEQHLVEHLVQSCPALLV
jgi:hypothetical protein